MDQGDPFEIQRARERVLSDLEEQWNEKERNRKKGGYNLRVKRYPATGMVRVQKYRKTVGGNTKKVPLPEFMERELRKKEAFWDHWNSQNYSTFTGPAWEEVWDPFEKKMVTEYQDRKNAVMDHYIMTGEWKTWDGIREKPLTELEKQAREKHSAYVSMSRTIQTVYDICLANEWDWFITVTFNPERVDSFDYRAVQKRLTNWLANQRKRRCPDLKYIFVPELHESGRIHFHGLMSNCGGIRFTPAFHPYKKDKNGDPAEYWENGRRVHNMDTWANGWSTATIVGDSKKASSYICKYLSKDIKSDDNIVLRSKGRRRYMPSKNLERPEEETDTVTGKEFKEFREKVLNEKKTVYETVSVVEANGYDNEVHLIEYDEFDN